MKKTNLLVLLLGLSIFFSIIVFAHAPDKKIEAPNCGIEAKIGTPIVFDGKIDYENGEWDDADFKEYGPEKMVKSFLKYEYEETDSGDYSITLYVATDIPIYTRLGPGEAGFEYQNEDYVIIYLDTEHNPTSTFLQPDTDDVYLKTFRPANEEEYSGKGNTGVGWNGPLGKKRYCTSKRGVSMNGWTIEVVCDGIIIDKDEFEKNTYTYTMGGAFEINYYNITFTEEPYQGTDNVHTWPINGNFISSEGTCTEGWDTYNGLESSPPLDIRTFGDFVLIKRGPGYMEIEEGPEQGSVIIDHTCDITDPTQYKDNEMLQLKITANGEDITLNTVKIKSEGDGDDKKASVTFALDEDEDGKFDKETEKVFDSPQKYPKDDGELTFTVDRKIPEDTSEYYLFVYDLDTDTEVNTEFKFNFQVNEITITYENGTAGNLEGTDILSITKTVIHPEIHTCDDEVMNGEETGEDCGGPDCDSCDLGISCEYNSDCNSGKCEAGVCICNDDGDCEEDEKCIDNECVDESKLSEECSGNLEIDIETLGTELTATASGLENCEGTIILTEDSCSGTEIESCEIDGEECSVSFSKPSEAGEYTYFMCFDMNEDDDYDVNEKDSGKVTVDDGNGSSSDIDWILVITIVAVVIVIVVVLTLVTIKLMKPKTAG